MKFPIFMCLFLAVAVSSTSAHAWGFGNSVDYPDSEWSGFDAHMIDRLKKIRELIGRGKMCKVAVYGTLLRDFTFDRSQFTANALDAYLPKSVSCIADISVNANTINEAAGCALVSYNSETGEYGPYFNRYFKRAMSKKTCSGGGFEEVMQMKGWFSGDAYQDSTVEQTLFTPKVVNEKWQTVLIYASQPSDVQWFQDAKKRGEQFMAEKLKARKKAKSDD